MVKEYSNYMNEALNLRKDIYRFVLCDVRNPADADDIVQETYARLCKTFSNDNFQLHGSLRSYLFKAARNSAARYYRKGRGGQRFIENMHADVSDMENSRNEDLDYLRDKLGETQFGVLTQLVSMSDIGNDTLVSMSLTFDEKLDKFKERLSFIHETYCNEGRVVFPPNISKIRFDPFSITFQRGRFEDGPLDYFRKHIEFYGRFSRTELFRVDPGLYKALNREGVMADAIPRNKNLEKRPMPVNCKRKDRFNGKPLEFLQDHPDFYAGLSRTELSRADQPLYNALRKEGTLEKAIPRKRPYKRELSSNESKVILSMYGPSNANARAASRCTGHSSRVIADHWQEHGLEVRSIGGGLLKREKKEIIDSYSKYGGVVSHASKELGYSRQKITDLWRNSGLEIDSNRGLEVMNKL